MTRRPAIARFRRRCAVALGLAIVTAAAAQQRPSAPASHCMDARAMREAYQPDPRTLAVLLADDRRFRVELADACPGAVVAGTAALVAPSGWVCGGNDEHVRVGSQRCAVSGMAEVDSEAFARLALAGHRERGITTLAGVEVKGERRRGFGGSPSYCLDSRHVRGWSEDGEGVVIEVAPRRSGGHRYYRLELAGSCPELSDTPAITLRSGVGQTAICGNPGDRIVLTDEVPDTTGSTREDLGFARPFTSASIGHRLGCAIAVVYPIDGPRAADSR